MAASFASFISEYPWMVEHYQTLAKEMREIADEVESGGGGADHQVDSGNLSDPKTGRPDS
jgi:hypothetical protein